MCQIEYRSYSNSYLVGEKTYTPYVIKNKAKQRAKIGIEWSSTYHQNHSYGCLSLLWFISILLGLVPQPVVYYCYLSLTKWSLILPNRQLKIQDWKKNHKLTQTEARAWEETRCRHIGYSFRSAARVVLYASSHRQNNTYHGLCYTSRGALAGTRNSSMGSSWRIDPTTHRTVSERSYHGATSRS